MCHQVSYSIFCVSCVSTSGSACLFSALLTKCSEKNVFALCRCISRRNYPPRFVALVPQKEEIDEGKVQTTPPGNKYTVLGLIHPNSPRLKLSPISTTVFSFSSLKKKLIVVYWSLMVSCLLPASGFNVIYLPYADDLRILDPPRCPTASQTQVDKMKEIVTKLRFKYR